jgi:hypothetical protein
MSHRSDRIAEQQAQRLASLAMTNVFLTRAQQYLLLLILRTAYREMPLPAWVEPS